MTLCHIEVNVKLWTAIILHHVLFWILLTTPFIMVWSQPWYLTVVITTLIVRIATSRDVCILTELEREWRLELGWKPLNGGFVKHYYWSE